MRKFFCPFLIFILTITFLSLVFSFSAGEEAGTPVSGDDHPSEEIVRAVMGYPWSGDMNCVKDCVDHETYTEVVLGIDRSDGTADDAATILADKNTGRVIRYRRSDYRMPAFLNENDLLGFNDDRETGMA